MDQSALLEELDQRQNEILDRLAELNARIEALLQGCLLSRDQAWQAVETPPPLGMPLPTVTPSDPSALTSQSRAAGEGPQVR